MENTTSTVEKLNQLILSKTANSLKGNNETAQPKAKKETSAKKETAKTSAKKEASKTIQAKSEKLAQKETKKAAKASLVEEVVSNREVKYIYPADCQDTLSRKTFRQKVRNQLHKLELEMLRIENKNSKEFKAKEKEYKEYKAKYVKEGAAA